MVESGIGFFQIGESGIELDPFIGGMQNHLVYGRRGLEVQNFMKRNLHPRHCAFEEEGIFTGTGAETF